jgi:hypothetical protein
VNLLYLEPRPIIPGRGSFLKRNATLPLRSLHPPVLPRWQAPADCLRKALFRPGGPDAIIRGCLSRPPAPSA